MQLDKLTIAGLSASGRTPVMKILLMLIAMRGMHVKWDGLNGIQCVLNLRVVAGRWLDIVRIVKHMVTPKLCQHLIVNANDYVNKV